MHKQIVVHLYDGIQLKNKKRRSIYTQNSMDDSQNNCVEWEKLDKKELYCIIGSLHRKLWKVHM